MQCLSYCSINSVQQKLINIVIFSPYCHPMSYIVLFSNSKCDWHVTYNSTNDNCQPVTALQFYILKLHEKENIFNPIHFARKSTQQYIIDAYAKAEGTWFNFIRQNQIKLQVELYKGLMKHFHNEAVTHA